jgi:hypothetical protein
MPDILVFANSPDIRGNILFCMRLGDDSAELGDGTIPCEDKVRPEASSFSEP